MSAAVAIPVRDEAERILDCLSALARQEGGAPWVLLFVNNTVDGTVAAVREAELGLSLTIVERELPPGLANAGQARRMAMALADELAAPGVPLLCTDADGRVADDWLARNVRHLRAGADAVFGRAVIDPVEALHIPPALHRADQQECAYARLLDEIEHCIDPDADDPWPRHTEHSGASIAVRRGVFRAVGGIPPLPLGEDRAFAAALRRVDARVRHAPDVTVTVSGRILGRAEGGMADTIRRRLVALDTELDDALEPVADRVARLRRRVAARAAWAAGDRAAPFGAAWAELDARWPRRRVAVAGLEAEMAAAERVLTGLAAVEA